MPWQRTPAPEYRLRRSPVQRVLLRALLGLRLGSRSIGALIDSAATDGLAHTRGHPKRRVRPFRSGVSRGHRLRQRRHRAVRARRGIEALLDFPRGWPVRARGVREIGIDPATKAESMRLGLRERPGAPVPSPHLRSHQKFVIGKNQKTPAEQERSDHQQREIRHLLD